MQVFEQRSTAADVPVSLDSHRAAARALEVARASSGALELFGSFMLDDEEFALPASSLREVVNFPDKITPVPLAPPFLEGVFTLRGHVIPVINLQRIFDPSAPRAQPSNKIAIIDHDDIQLDILFHSTGEVLRVRPEQRSLLQYQSGDAGGVICGTIVLDNGTRLLQILDAHALVHIENVPHVQALRAACRTVAKHNFQQLAERRQCVGFTVGGTAFAFDMSAIREIIMVPELKSSVMAGKLCLGRIHFRGEAVGVVDLAALLQFEHATVQGKAEQRILIARVGTTLVGLLVDSVDSIFNIFDDDILPIPLLSKTRSGMFGGCVTREGTGDILYLNHAQMFSQAELLEIGAGHVNLYQQEAANETLQAKLVQSRREVYIVFELDSGWAVDIARLREVIPYSGAMVKPPGMPAFVHGILNVRQQMISVIDLRSLYGKAPAASRTEAKILIIEHGDERYGLIVDKVDNIIHIAAHERRHSPRLGACGEQMLALDVIDYAGPDGASHTLSVFDTEAFIARMGEQL